jgi:soluble epoxide hydrolase/lipid-phosphate phosphatase
MAPDKIAPHDPRIQRKTALLNGTTYSYILAEPSGQPKGTIFLIHGWPDFSFGWRYQIPLLTSLGLRVVAPDMMGYAGTDAPQPLSKYTMKSTADDLAELARQLGVSRVILGGHDWGGVVVYRLALHYPKLVSAVFSVCTPFTVPKSSFVDATVLPNFKYQLHLRGPEVEANIVGEEKIRQFLNGMYGGLTPTGIRPFSVSDGVNFEALPTVGTSPLVSKEEMDFYVQSYARNGMRGPLNWYRTQPLNYEDEKDLAKEFEQGYKVEQPTLFIAGLKDAALPPKMSVGMEKYFKSLVKKEVDTQHWALWEKPDEVNAYIKEFLVEQIGSGKSNL